jgi:outer membrane protein assembly factor BamB
MARHDARDPNKDTTPVLFGPVLAGNALMVVDEHGELTTFKPETGERLGAYELASGVVSNPVIANGALYLITKDAKLHKYY